VHGSFDTATHDLRSGILRDILRIDLQHLITHMKVSRCGMGTRMH
jgi:hypothetical protein